MKVYLQLVMKILEAALQPAEVATDEVLARTGHSRADLGPDGQAVSKSAAARAEKEPAP